MVERVDGADLTHDEQNQRRRDREDQQVVEPKDTPDGEGRRPRHDGLRQLGLVCLSQRLSSQPQLYASQLKAPEMLYPAGVAREDPLGNQQCDEEDRDDRRADYVEVGVESGGSELHAADGRCTDGRRRHALAFAQMRAPARARLPSGLDRQTGGLPWRRFSRPRMAPTPPRIGGAELAKTGIGKRKTGYVAE